MSATQKSEEKNERNTDKGEEVKTVKTVIPKSTYDILSAVAVIDSRSLEDYLSEILKERAVTEQQTFKNFRTNWEPRKKS
jgi:hypothetical protein